MLTRYNLTQYISVIKCHLVQNYLEVIFVLTVQIHISYLFIFLQVTLRFSRKLKNDLFSKLENQLSNYVLRLLFVFGDFNGRTKYLSDFMQNDELPYLKSFNIHCRCSTTDKNKLRTGYE